MKKLFMQLAAILAAAPLYAGMDWEAAAVLDFAPAGSASSADTQAFAAAFRDKLLEAGKYTVVKTSRDDPGREAKPCFDDSCALAAGKRMNVKKVFIGKLRRKGAGCALTMQELDTASGEKELSVTQDIRSCAAKNFHAEAATLAYAVSGRTPASGESVPDAAPGPQSPLEKALAAQDPLVKEKFLSQAIAAAPKAPEPLVRRGNLYIAMRRWADAEADFGAALALEPDNASALAGRGFARAKNSRVQQGLDDLSKAAALADKSAAPLALRALVYADMGDFTRASADIGNAATREPESSMLLGSRGLVRYMQGQSAWALDDLGKAIAQDASDPRWLEARADIYLNTKQYTNAIADLNRAIKLDPQNPLLFRMRAKAYRERWDTPRANDDDDNAAELERKQAAKK